MSEVVAFPQQFHRDARGKILPIIIMMDYGRRAAPRFYVTMEELDGGWSSYEYIGNRHCDALDAIDRVKAEREIGDVRYVVGEA